MTTPADTIESVKQELKGLREVGVLNDRSYAATLRYVANNEAEIIETAEYASISEVADTVVDIAAACSNGKCDS